MKTPLVPAPRLPTTHVPIVPSAYEDIGLSCPHGVRFYAEPTGDQIAAWTRDGVM